MAQTVTVGGHAGPEQPLPFRVLARLTEYGRDAEPVTAGYSNLWRAEAYALTLIAEYALVYLTQDQRVIAVWRDGTLDTAPNADIKNPPERPPHPTTTSASKDTPMSPTSLSPAGPSTRDIAAAVIEKHPRYERADGVVFCQHAHAFSHFDDNAGYAQHLADAIVAELGDHKTPVLSAKAGTEPGKSS